jgi:hypothetical protein
MEITYWELAGFLAMTPFLIYIAYWKGWKQGKREGYQYESVGFETEKWLEENNWIGLRMRFRS